MTDERPVLRIGHSPDPDDAFMWWPLTATSGFDTGRFRYETVAKDIDKLNRLAETGELEITALSCAQYARVADRYVLTTCGASVGQQYGPLIVSRQPMATGDLQGVTMAIPGERTSAFAAASVLLGRGTFSHVEVPFDQIMPRVAAGEFDAGLLIHEGQLTFDESGLHMVADLGMWWSSRCGLPLPLGVNAIRRDVAERHGAGAPAEVSGDLKRCLEFALEHRGDALAYALRFARNLKPELVERFVDMYVNRFTLDLGSVGREAIRTFLQETHRVGLAPDPGEVDFV